MHLNLLKSDESYTFSQYFSLKYPTRDVLAEFEIGFRQKPLFATELGDLDSFIAENLPTLETFKQDLQSNLACVELTSEAARRETLIGPILLYFIKQIHGILKIEYPLEVNQYLRGDLDYLLSTEEVRSSGANPTVNQDLNVNAHPHVVVVEAKQADITRGFTQLAIELIAVAQKPLTTQPMIYGAVTTGNIWQFGAFDQQENYIVQDTDLYVAPKDLAAILLYLQKGLGR